MVGQMPEGDFPPHGPPPPFRDPHSIFFYLHILLGPRHLTVLLIGALFCYWLARHLTMPLVKLRDTARELADGNLSARVSESLTRRSDELGYLGRDFNLMAERIESLVQAQRRLLRDISHELRSPLTRLGVALQLVRRRAGPEIEQGLDRIEREAESINGMIGQLLALSRVETGAGRLTNVRIDLCALLSEVADDADFEARSRNRSVRVAACEPCHTTGVPELLRSAVENVLRNAVHYTAEATEVEISLRLERDESGASEAVISVRDYGKGVPQEAIDEIFRPFYRVEDARDRQTGGTGLGLAIAARAVRLHGGHINATNADGGGLLVQLRLPIQNY
jgi:two-component system sensor histidine kinase CpxA